MFNQRSSTPKQKLDLPLSSPVIGSKSNRSLQNRSPGISPVSSPVKSKSVLSQFKDEKSTNHETQNVVRRKPRKQGDRPRVQNRPKSLMLPPHGSFDEMLKDHYNQTHSDTEVDDESKSEKLSKKDKLTEEEKPARKLRQSIETVKDISNTSLIVRDIDIDDSVKSSSSRKSWLDNTVIFKEKHEKSGMSL